MPVQVKGDEASSGPPGLHRGGRLPEQGDEASFGPAGLHRGGRLPVQGDEASFGPPGLHRGGRVPVLTAEALVVEAEIAQGGGIEQVAGVDDGWVLHPLSHLGEVQPPELVPLSQHR